MATIEESTIKQATREIRAWTVDFTDDLPTGGTVSAGTAFHVPPSGDAVIPTIAVTSSTVSATLDTPTVLGVNYLDVQATFSNNEKSEVRITFPVAYESTQARSGMATLVHRVRSFANIGPVDYEVAGVPYWSDAQVQEVLDDYRTEIHRSELFPVLAYEGAGTVVYKEYHAQFQNIESGTAVFELELATGAGSGTANYTMNYALGIATFTNDQGGTAHFMTGRSYDLNAAAAEIWRIKAAQVAHLVSFSTDNHSINRSDMRKGYLEMAGYYASQGAPKTVKMDRGDLP